MWKLVVDNLSSELYQPFETQHNKQYMHTVGTY